MAIDFPASPSNGQTFTDGSTTWTWDGTKWSITSGAAGATDKIEEGNTSAEVIDTGSDGRFVVTTEGSERLRVDASGRLLVGTSTSEGNMAVTPQVQLEGTTVDGSTSAIKCNGGTTATNGSRLYLNRSRGTALTSRTVVASGDTLGTIFFGGADGANIQPAVSIAGFVDGTPAAGDMPGRLVFSTTADGASSPTERMRIGNNGILYSVSTNVGYSCVTTVAAGTSIELFEGKYGATVGSIASGTQSFRVWTNGNVQNTNNSYTAISDIKLKENIVNANSQWNDIKALQVRNYNLKEGQTHTQIGLIAQEVEPISPGLVYESPDRDEDGNDLGTVTKSVNYSVLYMKAVKALQEAMERIETLEGMVAVNNITIDEQQHQLSTLAARLTALESA